MYVSGFEMDISVYNPLHLRILSFLRERRGGGRWCNEIVRERNRMDGWLSVLFLR